MRSCRYELEDAVKVIRGLNPMAVQGVPTTRPRPASVGELWQALKTFCTPPHNSPLSFTFDDPTRLHVKLLSLGK
jgi:hypothetical protein